MRTTIGVPRGSETGLLWLPASMCTDMTLLRVMGGEKKNFLLPAHHKCYLKCSGSV